MNIKNIINENNPFRILQFSHFLLFYVPKRMLKLVNLISVYYIYIYIYLAKRLLQYELGVSVHW